MPKLTVYDAKGASVGSVEIEPTDLAPRINKQLLHDAVVMYEANLRQGTFATKSRALVAGSTKKMYRQKGTGNARAGSRRSGIRRGGGHILPRSRGILAIGCHGRRCNWPRGWRWQRKFGTSRSP
jgi:large subunit ribosomal protein L4